MIKKIFTLVFALASVSGAFAFDWPQNEIESDSFFTYFSHLRGGVISPSLVFSGSNEIKTADEGLVTAVISEHDESSLFESTLGNAVIVAHKDSLITVYANLNSAEQDERLSLTSVESGTPLGNCGNSGWQEGNALLEFQVADLKAKTLINPRVLMPRFGNELPLYITNVSAVNKKGKTFDFSTVKRLASGTYSIYRELQQTAMPYKTEVYVNGALADSITYDTLISKDGKICTNSHNKYPLSAIYPDSKKQLSGVISIPKGHSKITVSVTDILGKEKSLTYAIDAY